MAKTFYVNIATPQGVETIDEYRGDQNGAEYLIGEYRLVYRNTDFHVYLSREATTDWLER
jgi:hypothetical protein